MTKRKQIAETKEFNAAELVRQGWLAYLGAYGLVIERAKPALPEERNSVRHGWIPDPAATD